MRRNRPAPPIPSVVFMREERTRNDDPVFYARIEETGSKNEARQVANRMRRGSRLGVVIVPQEKFATGVPMRIFSGDLEEIIGRRLPSEESREATRVFSSPPAAPFSMLWEQL